MRNAECGMRNRKKETKNSEFYIPNSELGNALASRPQVCFFAEKGTAKGKGCHGDQAEGIRILILRRLFFHGVGPVPGRFAREDGLSQSCLWSYFLAGLSLRRIGGRMIRKL
jgi:hypothetical protein